MVEASRDTKDDVYLSFYKKLFPFEDDLFSGYILMLRFHLD
jgi:hypothetical protein